MIERAAIGKIHLNDTITIQCIGCPLNKINESPFYCIVGDIKGTNDKSCTHLDVPYPKDMTTFRIGEGVGITNIFCYYPEKPPNPGILDILKTMRLSRTL